jgi:hypothetical protein
MFWAWLAGVVFTCGVLAFFDEKYDLNFEFYTFILGVLGWPLVLPFVVGTTLARWTKK